MTEPKPTGLPEGPRPMPTGDDLLWYMPDRDYRGWEQEMYTRTYACERCNVRWQQSPEYKVRCWCCGRFHKKYPYGGGPKK